VTRVVEVWLDAEGSELTQVGTLHDDRGQIRFRYAPAWLSRPEAFALDPDLTLDAAPFFPRSGTGNFGVFLDSSPDRWGQTLMNRREALLARDEGRRPRALGAWDFLLGVQDLTRQGALRLRDPDTGVYLANERLAAPPVTSLAELEQVARELTNRQLDDLEALGRWLAVLVAPGASLGGARPKANFTDRDGSLWIGKFPARNDDYDQGAWELLIHRLAARAGIIVPPARAVRLSTYHTFCVQRFDRSAGRRRFYVSALTLLRRADSENASYLEIAQALQNHGDQRYLETDLEQLFRRVLFNVMVGNRDDHLRNHGFMLGTRGWRLAPAFDMNAVPYTPAHVLALDDRDSQPSVSTVLATHAFYRLDAARAAELLERVASAVDAWPAEADRLALSRAEQSTMTPAFAAHALFRHEGAAVPSRQPQRGRRRRR
jgi:serine/threonine-protein kinase HipA